MADKPLIAITGASSGIGEATARAFSAAYHPVLLMARRLDRLEALRLPNAVLKQVDVRDRAALTAAVVDAESQFGPVDMMFANARHRPSRRHRQAAAGRMGRDDRHQYQGRNEFRPCGDERHDRSPPWHADDDEFDRLAARSIRITPSTAAPNISSMRSRKASASIWHRTMCASSFCRLASSTPRCSTM